MSKPALKSAAPDFTAPVAGEGYEAGSELTLSSLQGRPVVLYFYPKDDTPGCTKQACIIRDAWQKVTRRADLLGVSIDPIKKHEKFIQKYGLPFPLISDPDHKVAEAYGVWVEKLLYGRRYMGMERSTFVIDEAGQIQTILEKVKPELHLDLVLAAL